RQSTKTRDRCSGSRAVERVGGVRADPLDARVRALDRGHLDLDQELWARKPCNTAPERRGAALGEPGRALTVRAVHADAVDGECTPAHNIVQARAGLLQRPAGGAYRQIGLRRPVARRLRLARGVHRRAAADPDPVSDRHRPRVAAWLLALLLGVNVTAGLRGADDRFGL